MIICLRGGGGHLTLKCSCFADVQCRSDIVPFQTLREMYHDVEAKHSSRCPNEPEFRAYMVLMKLNEGDILRCEFASPFFFFVFGSL